MITRRLFFVLGAAVMLAGPWMSIFAGPAVAMGFESLTCGELLERKMDFLVRNGYCPPPAEGQAASSNPSCKFSTEADVPLSDDERMRVALINRAMAGKNCK